jgi:hypothetical protein
MKPAGPKSAFADFEEGSPFGVLDAADLDSLDGGEHAGGHASADKLPDADFFNGARAQMPPRGAVAAAASRNNPSTA